MEERITFFFNPAISKQAVGEGAHTQEEKEKQPLCDKTYNFIQLLTAVLIQAEDSRLLSNFYLHD